MRKRILLVLGLVALVLLGGYVALRLTAPPVNRIDHDGFESLRKGMGRAEVESALGAPPGDHVSESVTFVRPVSQHLRDQIEEARPPRAGEVAAEWAGNRGKILVWFGPDDRLTRKAYWPAALPNESFLGKVRRWLGIAP